MDIGMILIRIAAVLVGSIPIAIYGYFCCRYGRWVETAPASPKVGGKGVVEFHPVFYSPQTGETYVHGRPLFTLADAREFAIKSVARNKGHQQCIAIQEVEVLRSHVPPPEAR